MRFVVMLVAILGGLGSAFLGYVWFEDFRTNRDKIDRTWKEAQAAKALVVALAPDKAKQIEESSEFKTLKFAMRRGVTSPFLLAGLLMGVIGGIVAMERRGFSAALVFLTAAVGPLVVHAGGLADIVSLVRNEEGFRLLICTSGLYLAALLSLFVWAPRPKEDRKAEDRKAEDRKARARKEEEEDDRDDDEDFDDDED